MTPILYGTAVGGHLKLSMVRNLLAASVVKSHRTAHQQPGADIRWGFDPSDFTSVAKPMGL
jgi:hypothetical protein